MTDVKPGRGLATQTQYPWRTALRSGAATFIAILTVAGVVAPVAAPFVEQYIPDATARLLAIGGFCAGLAVLLKRIGTLPAFAALLVQLGIGVVPKSELDDGNVWPVEDQTEAPKFRMPGE